MSSPTFQQISALSAASALADVDLLAVYKKTGSTFAAQKMTVANLRALFLSGGSVVNVTMGYEVSGVQVVGQQQSPITNPTGNTPSGSDQIDIATWQSTIANLQAQMILILIALRTHGLIDT